MNKQEFEQTVVFDFHGMSVARDVIRMTADLMWMTSGFEFDPAKKELRVKFDNERNMRIYLLNAEEIIKEYQII